MANEKVVIKSLPFRKENDPAFIQIQFLNGATNGDMIKAMFDVELVDDFCQSIGIKLSGSNYIQFNKDWWNAPYKGSRS